MSQQKLGELLLRARVLQEPQLKAALAEQQRWGSKLGEVLVRMNMITEDLLVKALSRQLSLPVTGLHAPQPAPRALRKKLPEDVARELFVVPLELRDNDCTLVVAMADPTNARHLEILRGVSRCRISPQIAGRSAIASAFDRIYAKLPPEPVEDDGPLEKTLDDHPSGEDADEAFVIDNGVASFERQARWRDRHTAPPAEPSPAPVEMRGPRPQGDPAAARLQHLEDAQRKEFAAIKALVELMIEKGLFTREEYLAKLRR